jgi:hypothetical protein
MKLDSGGSGVVTIGPNQTAMEWDIYQISLRTTNFVSTCWAVIEVNGFFLCSTPQGSLDTATGPPDTVLQPGDEMTVLFVSAHPNDLASVGIWYNENPVGTTMSTAH